MNSDKPHRIRVKVTDGKPRDRNKVKGQLVPHVDVVDVRDRVEFVICAVKPAHLDVVRAKLAAAGLEEVSGGHTTVSAHEPPGAQRPAARPASPSAGSGVSKHGRKPYGFVQLPIDLAAAGPPVWHDGSGSAGRLSGEVRFEVEALTPLLVGWERRRIDDRDEPWSVPNVPAHGNDIEAFLARAAEQAHPDDAFRRRDGMLDTRRRDESRASYMASKRGSVAELAVADAGRTIASKSVLCPLRAPWGERPVIIPGDSLKGLLRHELGALLGAPMERVDERSYSYRPNLQYPDSATERFLEPRLARVVTTRTVLADGEDFPFPERLDVLRMATRSQQEYFPRQERDPATGRLTVVGPTPAAEPYRGGLGGGRRLPDEVLSADARRRMIHHHLDVGALTVERSRVGVDDDVKEHYTRTLSHLLDPGAGHFSARHPNVGTDQRVQRAATAAIRVAACGAFQPGDLIWVEWDTRKKRIVSLGWHYYYRWAYTDTVRRKGWTHQRHGLFPLTEELATDSDDAPKQLSAIRRLFGYTGDNEGSKGIGRRDHEQLMGRLSVNAAVEIVEPAEAAADRFLPPTFLKELGMPRPSAVEHYLEQPHHPKPRPSDKASLVTYGDATGYDEPGKLAGRKFYLDRADAYTGEPWKDDTEANRLNDRSTLALEASRPGRRFRFTLRFRDLEANELAAILLALCPHQLRAAVGGSHDDGYCSKLGYARPLGWGSVRIEAKELLLLDQHGEVPTLQRVANVDAWFRDHHQETPQLASWLATHRRNHPEAGDYPRGDDGNIYSFHTDLRAKHSRARRYDQGTGK